MKNTREKILLAFLAVSISGAILLFKTGMNVPDKQNGAKADVDATKELKCLSVNTETPGSGKKETVLRVPWGEEEEQLRMSVYNGDTCVSYETPTSFAVGRDGCIYVYDTLNEEIKIFQNNKYQKSIPEPIILHDMDISSEGLIYGINHFDNLVIKIDEQGNASPFGDPENNTPGILPEAIDVLPSGVIMLHYSDNLQNGTAEKKLNAAGEPILTHLPADMAGVSLYECEDGKGNLIRMSLADMNCFRLEIFDGQTGERKGICNYSSAAPAGYYYGVTALGADREGYLYLWVCGSPDTSPYDALQNAMFIDRIDIVGNSVKTIAMDSFNWDMFPCSANVCSRMIKIDDAGNIYQVILSMEAYSIVKYSF